MKIIFFIIISHFFLGVSLAQDFQYPYNAFDERDPMRPLVNDRGEIIIRADKEIGDFFLQGIIYSDEGSVVIINGQTFRQGDTFEGYKIKKIEEKGVFIEKKGKEHYLKWEE